MKSKTMFFLLLIFAIFFTFDSVEAKECYITNSNGICITNSEYNNLINMGFYDFEIMSMDLNTYNANKDLEGVVSATTTKYIADTYQHVGKDVYSSSREVTEEEYNKIKPICELSSANTSGIGIRAVVGGYTETTGKRMDTEIIEYSNKLRYKVTVRWKVMPSVRSYDIIGIGLDDQYVYVTGNHTFYQTFCISAMTCTGNSTANILNQETGAGASFKLPSGNFVFMSSYFYYDVGKKVSSPVTLLYAYGDYAHATKNVTASQAAGYYTVGYNGLGLYSDIVNKYDAIPSANARWMGSW